MSAWRAERRFADDVRTMMGFNPFRGPAAVVIPLPLYRDADRDHHPHLHPNWDFSSFCRVAGAGLLMPPVFFRFYPRDERIADYFFDRW
jgi:hypothetical protein